MFLHPARPEYRTGIFSLRTARSYIKYSKYTICCEQKHRPYSPMLKSLFIPMIIAFSTGLFAGGFANAQTAELVVVTRDGCVWCNRWNAEIAPIYPKTEEGRVAPIREINISDGWPDDLATIRREPLTPSFILISGGVEIGRLRGYSGDEFFWFLLGELLAKLPDRIQQ